MSEQWAKMVRRLKQQFRRGSEEAETQRDEELGIRNETEDVNRQNSTQAVAHPPGEAPRPRGNAAPSSADLTLNEPLGGLDPEAQYLIDNALPHQKHSIAKSIQQNKPQDQQKCQHQCQQQCQQQDQQQQAQVQQHNDDASSVGNEALLTPQNTRTTPPTSIKDAEETA